jgi:transposase
MIPRPNLSKLDEAGKDALILSLVDLANRLMAQVTVLEGEVAALKAKLGLPPKTPENSSVPPSRGGKPSDPAVGGKSARGKPHGGVARALCDHPTAVRRERVASCPGCGAGLEAGAERPWLVYDHIDLPPILPVVTRVELMAGRCACCRRRYRTEAPADMPYGSPFGPGLVALVLHLRFTQAIALKRLKGLLCDVFGVELSAGALAAMIERTEPAFAAQAERIAEDLKQGAVIESDETGLRVAKTNRWLWTFHHGASALVLAQANRGKAAVVGFLGDWRPDYWLSDRYGAQMGWAKRGHQICLAHLDRDLQYAIDCGETVYAGKLRGLIKRACRIGRRRPRLADATLKAYAMKLDRELDTILEAPPRCRHGEKLLRLIKRYRQHLFVFLEERGLEPTNNGSERTLRPCVTFRKIIGGFRTEKGAHFYAAIRSVLETARRRAVNPLQAIRLTLIGAAIPLPLRGGE